MKSTVLIDTNIFLDVFMQREPFYDDSKAIFDLCIYGKVNGVIAAHSFTNIWYVMRKKYDDASCRTLLATLIELFKIERIDKAKLFDALKRTDFKDFEDCLQDECAQADDCSWIITRNAEDFKFSKVPAVTPEQFLKQFAS